MRLPLSLVCFLVTVVSVWAANPIGEVNRTPPPVYQEQLAAFLTPCEAVLAGRTAFPDDKTGGVVLLAEAIHYRDAEGKLYKLLHNIYYAVDQSSLSSLGTDTITYDRERETIFLVAAATLRPDGTRQEVDPKGTFLQTPQHEAANSLYTSQAELHLVYPNVAPGTITEMIVLIRENTPVMPGEYAAARTFASGWPTFRERFLVELPQADWQRMQCLTPAGLEPEVTVPTPGRERRTWSKNLIPSSRWEESAPAFAFRNPTVWLTTLSSWDEVARWFYELAERSAQLGPELQAAVEQWTAGLTDRQAIIDRLTHVAAYEIRYVGLEFGLAGYAPHSCDEIWKNRYGDCKDKANFLRALLARKGIRSHVVLLSTDDGGHVEKNSPSWKQFTHAILAIEQPGGGYQFCDPTVKHLPAGTIGLSDLGRDVLIVREGRADWVRTPDLCATAVRVGGDLHLAPNGELSGWFTLRAEGSDAAFYARTYNERDRNERLRALQQCAEDFFPGAEVIDLDYTPTTGPVRDFLIRAYLIRAPRAADGATLKFPYPASWLPKVNTSERRFPYLADRRIEAVDFTIELPAGWKAQSLPTPFSAPSETARFTAAWELRDRQLVARLSWQPERAELTAAEFTVFQQSIRALRSWLERPALLLPGTATADEPATATAPVAGPSAPLLTGFPILPTGAGQLRLLDEKFPAGEKDDLRRAAFAQILQWFPQDRETVFQAKVSLLLLDEDRLGHLAYAEAIAQIIAQYDQQVSHSLRAWAEYLEACARWQANQSPAALQRLQKMARDEKLNAFRRTWAAYEAGKGLLEKKPKDAAAFLTPFAEMEAEAQPKIVALLLRAHARAGDAATLKKWLAGFAAQHRDTADALLAGALGALAEDLENLPAKARPAVFSALSATVRDATDFPKAHPALLTLTGQARAGDAQRQFIRDFTQWLEAHRPAWWTKKKSPRLTTIKALIEDIETCNTAGKAEPLLDDIAQLFLHQQPDYATFAKYTDWLLWWLNKRRLDDALLDTFSRKALDLPVEPTGEIVECWMVRAAFLARQNKLSDAREVYQRIFQNTGLKPHQRVEAGGEQALMELHAGQVDAALKTWDAIVPLHTTHRHGIDYLYTALLVRLERGDYDQGLELLASIRQQEDKYLKEANHHLALDHLLRAAEKPAALKTFWQRQTRWWPQWEAVLARYQLKPTGRTEPPLATDFDEIYAQINKALAGKDPAAYLRHVEPITRLARWIPALTADFARLVSHSGQISTAFYGELMGGALPMVADVAPVDPQNDADFRMWENVFLIDLQRPQEAIAKSRALYRDLGPSDSIGEVALRLWVIAARGTPEEAESLEAIRTALAGTQLTHSRLDTVRIYSDSLMLNGNTVAHHEFLTREVARAGFSANSEVGRLLTTRLEQLRQAGVAAGQLTQAVKTWTDRYLDCLAQIPPATLDDPRFAALTKPLDFGETGFGEAETIKYNSLFALDERQSAEAREDAFYHVVTGPLYEVNDSGEYVTRLLTVLTDERLSINLRANLAFAGARYLIDYQQLAALQRLAAAPICTSLKTEYHASLQTALSVLQRRAETGLTGAEDSLTRLLAAPIDRLRAPLIERLLVELVLAGQTGRADALLAKTAALTVHPQLGLTAGALRLQWTRTLRATKELAPTIRALDELLTRATPVGHTPAPDVRHRLRPYPQGQLSFDERLALARDCLHTGRWLPEALDDVLGLLDDHHPFRQANPSFGLEALRIVLAADLPDAVRSKLIGPASGLSDLDRPEMRADLAKQCREFAAKPGYAHLPQCQTAIAGLHAQIALRTSRENRPAALFADLDATQMPPLAKNLYQLRFYFSRGQHDECLRLLDTLDLTQIHNTAAIRCLRRTLRRANRPEELQLLDEALLPELNRKIADLWLTPESLGSVFNTLALARELERPELIPEAWFDRALPLYPEPLTRANIQLERARLRQDWAAQKTAADQMLERVPDLYDLYYLRAQAAAQLGQPAAALADLRIYLQYSLSDPHYPEALALFRQLAPDEKTPGTP